MTLVSLPLDRLGLDPGPRLLAGDGQEPGTLVPEKCVYVDTKVSARVKDNRHGPVLSQPVSTPFTQRL